MKTLSKLHLKGSRVKRLDALRDVTSLTLLQLDDTKVKDLTPLAGLTRLQSLHLKNTPISDVSALSAMTALNTLALSGTSVTDISVLEGLTGLSGLYLDDTAVSDLGPIATLPGLHNLSIAGSAVTDLSPLHTLPKPEVGTLTLTVGQNVPESEIEALKAAVRRSTFAGNRPHRRPVTRVDACCGPPGIRRGLLIEVSHGHQSPTCRRTTFPPLRSSSVTSAVGAVITGTTSGTSRVAARTIASKGGRVFMLNRPSERAERVQAELSQACTSSTPSPAIFSASHRCGRLRRCSTPSAPTRVSTS